MATSLPKFIDSEHPPSSTHNQRLRWRPPHYPGRRPPNRLYYRSPASRLTLVTLLVVILQGMAFRSTVNVGPLWMPPICNRRYLQRSKQDDQVLPLYRSNFLSQCRMGDRTYGPCGAVRHVAFFSFFSSCQSDKRPGPPVRYKVSLFKGQVNPQFRPQSTSAQTPMQLTRSLSAVALLVLWLCRIHTRSLDRQIQAH